MSLTIFRDMITYCRPHGSASETEFINRFIAPLPGVMRDTFGNYHVCTDPTSTTLWSCHTDTVHRKAGRQTIHVDYTKMTLQLSKRSRKTSNCLGADDTTGCYLLREMILANVPGYYIFHYGEESGGIGSRALAGAYSAWLKERFKCAIALDRCGTQDIITHQGFRTASDAFALSLALALDMDYKPCSSGIYTDTAEYEEIIPECSNVSIGYSRAHSPAETQDLAHLDRLRTALLKIGSTNHLTIDRDPADRPVTQYWANWRDYSNFRDDLPSGVDMVTDDRTLFDDDEYADDDDDDDPTKDQPSSIYLDRDFEKVQNAIRADFNRRGMRIIGGKG